MTLAPPDNSFQAAESTGAVAAAPAAAADPLAAWPVPAGWKKERIPFPLEFAPGIAHRGVEELRFAPGMFEAGAPDWWSYGFVWWVGDRETQPFESLAAELRLYFRGLLGAAGREKKLALEAEKITVALHPLRMKNADGWLPMSGEAALVDAFGDGRPVALKLWVYQKDFPAHQRRAVLVLASPAPDDAAIWKALHALREAFPR